MAPALGQYFNNPYVNFLMSQFSGGQQETAQNEADTANEARYGQGLSVLEDAARGGLATYDADSTNAMNVLLGLQNVIPQAYAGRRTDFLGDYDRAAGGLQAGHADRYRFAEAELAGYGDQQRADVDRYFNEEQGQTQQDLLNRGLLSSTQTITDYGANTERRSAEQRRLAEDLIRNRIDVLGGYRGEALSAAERSNQARAAYDAALSGEPIAAQERYGGAIADLYGTNAVNRANMFTGGLGNIANWIGGRTDHGPPPNQYPFLFGQNSVQPPQPEGFQWESTIGPALGTAAAFALAPATGGTSLMFAPFASDRNIKTDIQPVNGEKALEAVRRLPVSRWKYRGDTTEHVGPMAQDFKEAFGLGDGKTISVIDAIGVLFAAVRELADKQG